MAANLPSRTSTVASVSGGPPLPSMTVAPTMAIAQGFQGALPAYRELVQSYAWVASNTELGR